MKPAIEEAILTVGSSLALLTLVKATFAMALGFCAAVMAGRKRAAFRHALLAGTFGVLLALPLVSAVAPPIRIALRVIRARNLPAPIARPSGATSPIVMIPAGVPAMPQSSRWAVSDLLLEAADLPFGPEQILNMMPDFMRDYIRLRKLARRTKTPVQFVVEAQIDINLFILGTIEGAGSGLRPAAR